MKFTIDKKEDYASVEVHEESITSVNAPELKSELVLLNTEGINSVILDLKTVKFIDSSGLSAILVGNRLCKDSGGFFALSSLSDQVEKLITISQLNNILNIFSSLQEAKENIVSGNSENSSEG